MHRQNRTSKEMVSAKNINRVSCSTPEHQVDSPSRDSDSIYDSDTASPVPFLCTQDGAEGETDVVWNFYTPKSEHAANSRLKNSTPVSRRSKRTVKPKIIVKQLPKRRPVKLPQKKTELFKELVELNELAKKTQNTCTEKANSEEDIFNDSPEFSPKSRLRSNSFCLRRNVLSSNFMKPESDAALESDDSMNECLIKASQIVEEKIKNEPVSKKSCSNAKSNKRSLKSDPCNNKIEQDSMDAILNSIKFESPFIKNMKKCDSPKLNNDSFDSLVGNLNDSALERLTQMPIKPETSKSKALKDGNNWSVKELIVHDNSPTTKSNLGRHNSMPESPTVTNVNLPSTSAFNRYSSMPFKKDADAEIDLGDSPIRCTPDEIKKKHQLAREKLMAKRLLPFTSSQKTVPSSYPTQKPLPDVPKKSTETATSQPVPKQDIIPKKFQPRVPTSLASNQNKAVHVPEPKPNTKSIDIKLIIERKRQEALMKLRRRAAPTK